MTEMTDFCSGRKTCPRRTLELTATSQSSSWKNKSALNLFCHLSEAVEVQGTFVFTVLDVQDNV